jgi:hypothetical protein
METHRIGWVAASNYLGEKMRTAGGFFCVAFCLFLGAPESKASTSYCDGILNNLVTNCGFETGDFTGWTLSGNDVPSELNNLYGVEGVDPFDGISPHSGSYQAFFGDLVANSTTISQTITTIPGNVYTISWFLAQDTATVPPYSNEFVASFGGSSVSGSDFDVLGYTQESFSVFVTAPSMLLSFTAGNDLGEFLLDDISVTGPAATTPEPAAWMLTMSGLLAGFVLLRRRRAQPTQG